MGIQTVDLKMMFHVLIFAVSVYVVSADFTCPDGKLTCAEGKTCCFQSGSGYSCCDKPGDTSNLISGTPSVYMPHKNQSFAPPSDSILDYCPFTSGMKYCCAHPFAMEECEAYSDCCSEADTCCLGGSRCCGNGQWCCHATFKCGPYYKTCTNGAMVRGVRGMAVIVTFALAVMKFAKM